MCAAVNIDCSFTLDEYASFCPNRDPVRVGVVGLALYNFHVECAAIICILRNKTLLSVFPVLVLFASSLSQTETGNEPARRLKGA